jgi:hypothetical protein
MTDLTNTDKYTAQFGFSPGVVVEIDTPRQYIYLGRFLGVNETGFLLETTYDTLDIAFTEIKSIRILTGPFAIWQFAKDWAKFAVLSERTGCFDFYEHKPTTSQEIMRRPWWCSKKETKNAKED